MRALKQRVLTASDIMYAEIIAKEAVKTRLDRAELRDRLTYIAANSGASIGIEELSKVLMGMLIETEEER